MKFLYLYYNNNPHTKTKREIKVKIQSITDNEVKEIQFSDFPFLFIKYEHIVPCDIDTQIIDILKKHYFVTTDRITITIQNKDFARVHSHPDVEARWTISGTGKFYIPANNTTFVIWVEEGDFIIIDADVPHWYEFEPEISNHHSLVRFFTAETGRKTNYLDWYRFSKSV